MNEKTPVRVRDVMTSEIEMVDGMMTIREALDIMRRESLKCVVVKKRHPDDEYGLLLLSDIARQVLARDRAPERVNVYEVMVKTVDRGRPRNGHSILCTTL